MPNFSTAIAAQLPAYLADLRALSTIDSGTHNKYGVDAVSTLVKQRLESLGAEVTTFPHGQFGDCLYGRWHGRGTARLLLLGHLDTIYPDGTVARHPLRQEGAILKGPGTCDMKAGLLSAVYAAHAVVASGFDQFAEIGIFCNSDEEIGSPVSRHLYTPLAQQAHAALVLEAARANGNIVSSRKGAGSFILTVRGRAAHAGVEPEKGANAILALCRHLETLQALNGWREGVTLAVGRIEGGTAANVVPDFARAEIDVRITRPEDREPLLEEMRRIAARQTIPGTSTELSGSLKPPMPRTPAGIHLADLAKLAAQELGFAIGDQTTGGSSDGNFTAALGIPTLDGLGPVGGDDHNAETEWIDLDSIAPRTAMLASLIVRICQEH